MFPIALKLYYLFIIYHIYAVRCTRTKTIVIIAAKLLLLAYLWTDRPTVSRVYCIML